MHMQKFLGFSVERSTNKQCVVFKGVFNSISSVNNEALYSIWIVHHNLRIIQFATNLSIYTHRGGEPVTCSLFVLHGTFFLDLCHRGPHAQYSHIDTLYIIIKFGRVGSKVKFVVNHWKVVFILIVLGSKWVLEIPQILQFPLLQSLLVAMVLHVSVVPW